MSKKNVLLLILPLLAALTLLTACKIKLGNATLKCNELTGNCEIVEDDTVEPGGDTNPGGDSGDSGDSENPGEQGGSSGSAEGNTNAEKLVNTALKYKGYTRQTFKPIAKAQGYTIGDETSWCAMFVSTIIKEAGVKDLKKYTSASVSSFMSAMVKDNRFYHSQYWYKKYNNFKDPIGPQPGDIIFFTKESCAKAKYKGNGILPSKTSDCYRHIGIVRKVSGSTITYIHGNTSNCKETKTNGVCTTSTKEIGSAYIIGYGR